MNTTIIELKNDINSLLERLNKLENMEENRNEIERIKIELGQLNNRVLQLEESLNPVRSNLPPQINYGYQRQNTYGQGQVSNLPPNIPNSQNIKNKNSEANFEKSIGTNVMSVLAAMLIFTGIVSLTAIVYKNFSETAKSILIISVTLLVSAIGFGLLQKKRSIFNYSVLAIGVGGVYISLIASGVMGVLNLYILTALVIGWTCLVHWQNLRYNAFIIYLIELIGFEIAIMFGLASIKDSYGIGLTLILCNIIYLELLSKSYKLKPNLSNILDIIIGLSRIRLVLLITPVIDEGQGLDIVSIYLIFIALVMIGCALLSIKNLIKKNILVLHIIISFIVVILSVGILNYKINTMSHDVISIISNSNMMILATLLYCFYINIIGLRKINVEISRNITYIIMIFGCIFGGMYGLFLSNLDYIIGDNSNINYIIPIYFNILLDTTILILILLVLKYTKDIFYKRLGLLFTFMHSISTLIWITIDVDYKVGILSGILIVIVGCVELIILLRILPKYLEELIKNKSILNKALFGFSFNMNMSICVIIPVKVWLHDIIKIDYSSITAIILVAVAVYRLYYSSLNYCSDFKSIKEIFDTKINNKYDWSYITFLIVNTLLIAVNILCGIESWDMIDILLITLSILILTFIGSTKILKQSNYCGIILGIKYAVVLKLLILMWNKSLGLSIPSIIYSVLLLTMCISFILTGWMIKNKSLRMFGLFGTMYSIFKLLFMDIYFDNPLIKTFAFIISGILCALIVWLYDRMNKEDSRENHE